MLIVGRHHEERQPSLPMNRRVNRTASSATLATIAGKGASGSSGPCVKKEEDGETGGLFGSSSDDEGAQKSHKVQQNFSEKSLLRDYKHVGR